MNKSMEKKPYTAPSASQEALQAEQLMNIVSKASPSDIIVINTEGGDDEPARVKRITFSVWEDDEEEDE